MEALHRKRKEMPLFDDHTAILNQNDIILYTMSKKQLRRRAYLLYRLRKQGIRCLTRCRTIFYLYGEDPKSVPQICSLISEFHFHVQFEIPA